MAPHLARDIYSCAESGNVEDLRRLLDTESKGDVYWHNSDNRGFTALMLACQLGHVTVCVLLMEKGADTNAKSNDGCTALMLAA
jgi:ankyrin repeat protein